MRLLGSHHSDIFMFEVYYLELLMQQQENPQMELLPNAGAKIYDLYCFYNG